MVNILLNCSAPSKLTKDSEQLRDTKHNNFPQFIVIHIVKGFGIVNKAAAAAAAAAKSLQSCPTLCDPRDGSPPGSPVPGIL